MDRQVCGSNLTCAGQFQFLPTGQIKALVCPAMSATGYIKHVSLATYRKSRALCPGGRFLVVVLVVVLVVLIGRLVVCRRGVVYVSPNPPICVCRRGVVCSRVYIGGDC